MNAFYIHHSVFDQQKFHSQSGNREARLRIQYTEYLVLTMVRSPDHLVS